MKKFISLIFIITLILAIIPLNTPSASPSEFVTVQGGKFILQGEEYKAMGVCLYPAHSASYDYIEGMIRAAKANGITLIRAVDLWENVQGGNDSEIFSENVWKRVDFIIKTCSENSMKVLLDISCVRQFLYYSPDQRDSYDPAVFPFWDEVIYFITNRVNSFTGEVYKNDPAIMSYAIAGEPVCYGGGLNDWNEGFFSSRDPEIIENSIFYISDKIRENDNNHLISSGGLLHLPGDFHKNIWSYKNIDYGSIHIYPPENDPVGEWANLPEYSQFCNGIGKPLMMEEFGDGGRDLIRKAEYIEDSYNNCHEAGLPVVILWNWSLGQTFDTFTHMEEIIGIIRTNARRMGYQGEFYEEARAQIDGEEIFTPTHFSSNTGDPGYGGAVYMSDDFLCIPLNFTQTYGWYWLSASLPSALSVSGDYIAADIYLPEDSPPITVKFSINGIEQNDASRLNNYLLPGRVNTVYASLDETYTSPEGPDFTGVDFDNIQSVGILFTNMNSLYQGNVYIGNIRSGAVSFEEKELDFSLSVNGRDIEVSARGGSGDYTYSYYYLKNGSVYSPMAYSKNQRVPLASGYELLRVYVQDSKNKRICKSLDL